MSEPWVREMERYNAAVGRAADAIERGDVDAVRREVAEALDCLEGWMGDRSYREVAKSLDLLAWAQARCANGAEDALLRRIVLLRLRLIGKAG